MAALAIAGLSVGSVLTTTAGRAAAAWPTGQGLVLNAPIVGATVTPTGNGYWEVGADGGIFTFGDARFYGSVAALTLAKPIVAMAATPDGRGYWEVASDGGVFAFGDAGFYGSTGALEPLPAGGGHRAHARRTRVLGGGEPTAGCSPSATPASTARRPVSPRTAPSWVWPRLPDGRGYWEAAADGAVFAFGDAAYSGDAPFVADRGHQLGRDRLPAAHGQRRHLHLRRRRVRRLGSVVSHSTSR